MRTRKSIDMTTGPILRKLFIYAYPLMLNSIINNLYSTVDTAMAGRCIGSAAMAAVGATTTSIGMMINLVGGISLGVDVSCSNFLGGRKHRELRECMHTAVPTGFLLGLISCLVGLVITEPLLVSLNTPENILPTAKSYMCVRMLGLPMSVMGSFCTSIFTSHGDTKTTTAIGILSGFVNVVCNYVFIVIVGMDVTGLAWATVVSQVVDVTIKLYLLFSPKGTYKMHLSELRLRIMYLKRIVSVGVPNGLNLTLFSVSNMLLQSSVNSFGEMLIAANVAADNCASYVYLILSGFSSACVCAVAQCYGAGNNERIKEVMKKSLIGCMGLAFLVSSVVTVFSNQMLGIFTEDAEVAVAGIPKLMIMCWGYLIHVFDTIFGAALKGVRKSTIVFTINVFGICIPRVLWVLFVVPLMHTPNMLYAVYIISWTLSSVLMGIAYRRQYKKLTLQSAV